MTQQGKVHSGGQAHSANSQIKQGEVDICNKGGPFHELLLYRNLAQQMQFKEKENVWCCLLDCGVRCLPGTSDNRPQKVVSSMSLMTNIQELNNSVEEGVMLFTVCNPWGCHGCELQSFHSIAKYLQRTISCFKNDKSLTWRGNILVLVNYFRRVALC